MPRNPLYDQMQAFIEEHGQSVTGVFDPEGKEEPFCYTIGNHSAGLPELLIIAPQPFWFAINVIGAEQRARGFPFPDGARVSCGEGAQFPVMVLDVDLSVARSKYTIQAGRFYGDLSYRVQQIIFPDKSGVFPGEPGYDTSWFDQTILPRADGTARGIILH